jgi:hypothetical protein
LLITPNLRRLKFNDLNFMNVVQQLKSRSAGTKQCFEWVCGLVIPRRLQRGEVVEFGSGSKWLVGFVGRTREENGSREAVNVDL